MNVNTAIDILPDSGSLARMEVALTDQAKAIIAGLMTGKKADPARAKKIRKTIEFLAVDSCHPGLATHRYESLDQLFDEKIWESYVEHRTPSAWRIWWFYGPGDDRITVVDIGPHP